MDNVSPIAKLEKSGSSISKEEQSESPEAAASTSSLVTDSSGLGVESIGSDFAVGGEDTETVAV